MSDIQKLKEQREKIVVDQRAMLDLAEKEERDFTDDENQTYENMDKDFDAVEAQIKTLEEKEAARMKRLERIEEREKALKESKDKAIKPEPDAGKDPENRTDGNADQEKMDIFRRFLMGGRGAISGEETRALQADSDIKGGFIVAPTQFMNELIKDLEDMVFVRKYSKVITMAKAESLQVPELVRQDDPTWTPEISTGAEDTGMGFKARMLTPHPLAKRILVSKKLLRVSTLNVDGEVRGDMGYKFGTTEENNFLNGVGVNQPLGVFVASDNGITTDRDVSAGNTTTAIKSDNLIECAYTLKAQYRNGARWLFHRDALKMIRKLKDGTGDYLWNSGLATNRPPTILDLPYDESEYAPNTFTSGSYVGLLANWRYYWVVDALNMEIQVLTELYAETNQNGYIGRKETDGAPVHENGFVRVTLG